MLQQSIKAEIVFTIPADQVLISKVEYEELKEANAVGKVCDIKKFADLLDVSIATAKQKVLENDVFRRRIDEANGGFVHYPKGQGDPYTFLEDEARKFIKDNFGRIFS